MVKSIDLKLTDLKSLIFEFIFYISIYKPENIYVTDISFNRNRTIAWTS